MEREQISKILAEIYCQSATVRTLLAMNEITIYKFEGETGTHGAIGKKLEFFGDEKFVQLLRDFADAYESEFVVTIESLQAQQDAIEAAESEQKD